MNSNAANIYFFEMFIKSIDINPGVSSLFKKRASAGEPDQLSGEARRYLR
jgi:hypothetical protein